MAQVVLVRHGQPTLEGEDHSHWMLSEEGREASRILSEDPIWEGVARIFTSPERKAEETAHIVAESRGIPVEVRKDLREIRRPFEAENYEDKVRAFLKGKDPEGWETRRTAETRLRRATEEIRSEEVDVGVVSHALLLTLFLAQVSSAEPTFWLHHSVGFAEYALYDSNADVLLQGFRRPRHESDSRQVRDV